MAETAYPSPMDQKVSGSSGVELRKSNGYFARPRTQRPTLSEASGIEMRNKGDSSDRPVGVFTGEKIRAKDIPDSPVSSTSSGDNDLNGDIEAEGHGIPVRLEKLPGDHGKKRYMLKVEGDIRDVLVELEQEYRNEVRSGKKKHRRKRFSDVSAQTAERRGDLY